MPRIQAGDLVKVRVADPATDQPSYTVEGAVHETRSGHLRVGPVVLTFYGSGAVMLLEHTPRPWSPPIGWDRWQWLVVSEGPGRLQHLLLCRGEVWHDLFADGKMGQIIGRDAVLRRYHGQQFRQGRSPLVEDGQAP